MTNKGRISVSLASTQDDYVSCMLIRSAVFVGEEGREFKVEFDGNDTAGAHLIATVDGAPAGTMRIRYFASFAVVERMAILKPYRKGRFGGRGVAWELGHHAFAFCREKGYRRFYGQARDGLVDFYQRFCPPGSTFTLIEGAAFLHGNMPVHPMDGHCPPLPGAIEGMEDLVAIRGSEAVLDARATARRAVPAHA